MQDIEQNMEELFRKAADDYPLKVSDSRWDDIAPALLNKPDSPAKKASSGKYMNLLLLFLSLLISDGIITDTLKNKETIPFLSSLENKPNSSITEKKVTADKHEEKKLTSERYFSPQSTKQTIATSPAVHFIKNKPWQKQTNRFKDRTRKNGQASAFPVIQTNSLNVISKQNTPHTVTPVKQEAFSASNKTANEKDEPGQKENQEPTEKNIEKREDRHTTGLYLGAVTGPLFDEIKNQGLKKTGFSAGIIAGYQLKNHLAFETGFLFAKKPYFSTGKYFRMDKISNSMPQGMEILSLEGNNFVWEIPVKIKYGFLYSNKRNFFSSAGISSYIMTHEKNNYLVLMNGAQQTMISSYKNKSRSLAATLDISTGYEHKIGKANYIRIEPYIQIPLKGMGVGSMQMMSSGLRIGITKFTN